MNVDKDTKTLTDDIQELIDILETHWVANFNNEFYYTSRHELKAYLNYLKDKSIKLENFKEKCIDGDCSLAIECLKEVREKIFGTSETGIVFDIPNIQDAYYVIDNKIEELEGE